MYDKFLADGNALGVSHSPPSNEMPLVYYMNISIGGSSKRGLITYEEYLQWKSDPENGIFALLHRQLGTSSATAADNSSNSLLPHVGSSSGIFTELRDPPALMDEDDSVHIPESGLWLGRK
ncbi:hypothetical protein CTheo_9244 [Ceratobasidium theobromae]|uniref:Uncharacterized protein n=1 Tax=Ceratobasidium theobromae TaxID=1582974 RepID=A0A5N5Q5Z9_9AGAM|nr:hypothetical protein CTheo_9244 [Ceratobasidium theobromae]